ncbi:MAG: TauD/TfdA dioxygenase family protein [Alphaproteobacteria bacterium]
MFRDSDFERFDVSPLTGALGADIRGVDLARDPGEAVIADLRRALHRYHVLAVRDQDLSPQRLHEVRERFGPFSGNPVHRPLDGFEDIVQFVREAEDTDTVIGENWHMDLAWLPKPPGITMLFAEVVPPVGGDTCFASLEMAYRALSPRLEALLRTLVGVHSGKGVYDINARSGRLQLLDKQDRVDEVETEHPVIGHHAATGRPYLFVSSVLNRFKGMTEAESRPIIDFLLALAVRPEFTCRLRWAQGTLGMWNNPLVLHTAINDYPSYRRVMYRTTVEGAVPQPAPAEAQAA